MGTASPPMTGRREPKAEDPPGDSRTTHGHPRRALKPPPPRGGMGGMGKTVLLLSFRDRLRETGWLCPSIAEFDAAHRGLAGVWADLSEELNRISPSRPPRPRRRWRVEKVDVKTTAAIGLTGPRASAEAAGSLRTGQDDLRHRLLELAGWLGPAGLRAAVLFDEAQDASLQDLGLLAEVGHEAGKERWPLLLVFAGLTPLHD